MKKTLVAIAALAAFGAASAQSSVTLYGRIEAGIGSQKTTQGGNTTTGVVGAGFNDQGITLRSGGRTGSRWGLRGSEDLGGGMKANFTLEQGFNIDNGTAVVAARQFHRTAKVGLSGGFGSLDVGRQYDIVDTMYATYDSMSSAPDYTANAALSNCTSAASPNAHAGAVGDCVVRQDNSVIYKTPKMGGLSATALWAPGENKTAAASAGKVYGVMVNYANGPFGIGAGYQSNKASGAVAATTHYILGAQYDLGVAKLFGQYASGKVKSAAAGALYEDKGFSLGAVVPFGAARLVAAYAKEDTDNNAGAKMQSTKAFGLMAEYDLSKRTSLYAAYRNRRTDPVGVAQIKTVNYGLGLIHNF